MAETCIVCLGDLPIKSHGYEDGVTPSFPFVVAGASDVGETPLKSEEQVAEARRKELDIGDVQDLIAHLLPCGHNLHDDCLKPWVERANSCPICRASFNQVELLAAIGGAVLASYAVEDKQQVADVDATMFTEDDLFGEEEPFSEPCLVCGDSGNEDMLLLCDGCEASCHTYCIGLEGVPSGPWYCHVCVEEHQDNIFRRSRRTQRTVAARRRSDRYAQGPSAWTRVWQQVWDRLNIDLDFPFDENARDQRTAAQRREFDEWQRRFQVAQRQGGRNRFTDTAAALLDPRSARQGLHVPTGESQEELRAWNAFDKARDILSGAPSNSRKRRSATTSPVEPNAEPERKLKRPRTRRNQDISGLPAGVNPESSRRARRSPRHRSPVLVSRTSRSYSPIAQPSDAKPSFFRNLLKEVEDSPDAAGTRTASVASRIRHRSPAGYSSPVMSSPEITPPTSNAPSPRALSVTPPPLPTARPSSPTPLTSSISPVFLPPPNFSPFSPTEKSTLASESGSYKLHQPLARRPRRRPRLPRDHAEARSTDSSPTRANMSYSAKSETQKMVAAALKPVYRSQAINKDQYTDINRDVSRMLYDKVGDATGLTDQGERDKWQSVAAQEVAKAVEAVRSTAEIEVIKGNEVEVAAS